jgi:hypothetical protein
MAAAAAAAAATWIQVSLTAAVVVTCWSTWTSGIGSGRESCYGQLSLLAASTVAAHTHA